MSLLLNRRSFLKTGLASGAVSASGVLPAYANEPLKIGFVYANPITNLGWSARHESGRQDIIAEFGDQVETTYLENIPDGPDSSRAIQQLALSGHKLIFTTSFGYMDPTIEVAKQFPDVHFEHCTGYKTAPNVSTYEGRFYEGRAVSGLIAGEMTKTGKLGYLAAFPIPQIFRGINAFTLAARRVNPDITVSVIWANTWYDPGLEADAASAFLNQGVDIFAQHTTSPAACQYAESAGAYCFGTDADMSPLAPDAHLTGTVNNWGPYYVERVRAVLNGTWKSQRSWGGMADGVIQMAPYSSALPDEVVKKAESFVQGIKDRSQHPFDGPITNADGAQVKEKGTKLTDEDLVGMNWYVEGVNGKLPT